MTDEAIKYLYPLGLPVKTFHREAFKPKVPASTGTVSRLRNEGHVAGQTELVHRRCDPPIDLNRIVCEDLPDFRSANICRRECDREVVISGW
jgi:hypothetical protein